MSRILEVVFVIGCSVVGLGMSVSEGRFFQNSVKSSVQLVSTAHRNVSWNVAHFKSNLCQLPVLLLTNHR